MGFGLGEADGFGEFGGGREGGAGEDEAAVAAERVADGVGGVDAGEGEFGGAGRPEEFFEEGIGEPLVQRLHLPEDGGEVLVECGIVEWGGGEGGGELREGVGEVGFERGIE